MLDGWMRRLIDPALARAGEALSRARVSPDLLTLLGLVTGLAAAAAIALRQDGLALLLLILSRVLDGLDGATARASRRTDRGGFMDIVFDFAFYGAIPLSFAIREPGLNALPASVLLFSFYVNGASFLAFAAVAAKRGLESRIRGVKSIYFTAGLAEGTETILVFTAMCLWPEHFAAIAWVFAALAILTTLSRWWWGWRSFSDK
jgi:phosphatidylglycerophosphate synthase